MPFVVIEGAVNGQADAAASLSTLARCLETTIVRAAPRWLLETSSSPGATPPQVTATNHTFTFLFAVASLSYCLEQTARGLLGSLPSWASLPPLLSPPASSSDTQGPLCE